MENSSVSEESLRSFPAQLLEIRKNPVSITIVYALMGFFYNFQVSTVRTSNMDLGRDFMNAKSPIDCNGVQKTNITGSVLIVEHIPEIFQEFFNNVLGDSMMKKFMISLVCSALGFYLIGYGLTLPLRFIGVAIVFFSTSLSFSAMMQNLAFANKGLIIVYNVGLQSAFLIAPLIYTISANFIPFAACLWPLVAFPILQCIVFWIMLKCSQNNEQQLTLLTSFKHRDERTRELLQRYKQHWKILTPYILLSFLQFYTYQGLFRHLSMAGVRTSLTFNFRLFVTVFRGGHFLGAILTHCVWTHHTWILPMLDLVNFTVLLTGIISDIKLGSLIPLILWDGILSGFGKMCTLLAINSSEDDAESAATDYRLVRFLEKLSGLAASMGLLASDEALEDLAIAY